MSSSNFRGQSQDEYLNNSKVLLAVVISLSVVIAFVLHAYARWFLDRRSVAIREPLRHRSLTTFLDNATDTSFSEDGLDAKVIALLLVFTYNVGLRGAGLECVICLSVFEEGEKGRTLPNCNHSFHVNCVDMWLMSHSTCPICRTAVKPVGDDSVVTVLLLVEEAAADREMVVVSRGLEAEVSVEIPTGSTSTFPTPSSSLGSSLKRMLSKSRLGSSIPANCSISAS